MMLKIITNNLSFYRTQIEISSKLESILQVVHNLVTGTTDSTLRAKYLISAIDSRFSYHAAIKNIDK